MSKQIENLIRKYLMNVDLAEKASDEGKERLEQNCIENQFKFMERIEEYSKNAVKQTCKESTLERVNTFYKMYFV